MGSTRVEAPPARDYYKEMMDTIRAQVDSAPMILKAERELTPQFQQLQYEQMTGQAKQLQKFYGEQMTPFAKLGGEYAKVASEYTMKPIAQGSRSAYEASLGGGADLQNQMRTQAFGDLNAGMGLTPEMQRESEQQARASMSARGLAGGNQGVASEILGSYNMGMQRQDRARNFAGAVIGQDMAFANAGYQQYGQPMMANIMQGYSPTAVAGNALGMNQNLGGSYVQPESQMAQNIYGSNYNAQLQARVATAQNNSAMWSAGMSAVGSAAGAMCWVAREVYGEDNPKWMVFRDWLTNNAPKWLYNLYLKHGEKFAGYIKDKPFIKSIVRGLMNIAVDSKIKSNNLISNAQ